MNIPYFVSFKLLIGLFSLSCTNNDQNEKQDQITGLEDINYDRPNILWISVEDISCNLASYGDSTANTPNIDKLAAEGIVFDNAFATSGVCTPSRSSIITAMHSTFMGTSNLRTFGFQIPTQVKLFPEYLREVGYYCTNNHKEDYNFETPPEVWDESSQKAHYYHRPDENMPFFAVYNLFNTHESQIWNNFWDYLPIDPDSVDVPDYYPVDNYIIRRDIARKYANIEIMDLQIGQIINRLEREGLLDKTIIVFWSDHGGMLPRQKREIYHSGLKVPLIIRFPNKEMAGTRNEDLISLIDLGPSMLAFAGIDKPSQMQGKTFLADKKEATRQYIFGTRDRIDANYELSRTIFDGEFRYVRNYYPETRGYKYGWFRFQMPMMQELYRLYKEDSLQGVQKKWFRDSRPKEELYAIHNDKYEVTNLAGNPDYAKKLSELRNAYLNWQHEVLDLGLLPEGETFAIQEKYQMPTTNFLENNPAYYYKVIKTLNMALEPEKYADSLAALVNDTIPSVRYWAARGIGRLGTKGKPYYSQLIKIENDASDAPKVSLAWALYNLGYEEKSKKVYLDVLNNGEIHAKTMALNNLVSQPRMAKKIENKIKEMAEDEKKYLPREAAKNVLKELDRIDS
jgi:arylsulfatase A-like enzyme